MGFTNSPNGLTSFGVPLIGSGPSIPVTTGMYFFVDSGNPKLNLGTINQPFATIDGAINKCVAGRGDVIIVGPGHSESIVSATSLVPDIAGVQIVGLGVGNNRPQLTFDNTAARILFSADNVKMSNIIFMCSLAAVVSAVTVTGENVEILDCEWNLDATGVEFLQMLDLDTADYAKIIGCKFVAENIAGCNTGIRIDASPGAEIKNCTLRGDYTTAAISGNAGTAATSDDIEISGCVVENLDTTAGLTIDVHDDTTGIISDNRHFTLFATAPETAFDPGDCLCCENYVVNAVNESGTIVPVTLST